LWQVGSAGIPVPASLPISGMGQVYFSQVGSGWVLGFIRADLKFWGYIVAVLVIVNFASSNTYLFFYAYWHNLNLSSICLHVHLYRDILLNALY